MEHIVACKRLKRVQDLKGHELVIYYKTSTSEKATRRDFCCSTRILKRSFSYHTLHGPCMPTTPDNLPTNMPPMYSILHLLLFLQTQTLTYTSAHSSLWMHVRTPYPYEHLWRTKLDRQISWDWRSHHRRLTINGHVAYHWKNNAIKC